MTATPLTVIPFKTAHTDQLVDVLSRVQTVNPFYPSRADVGTSRASLEVWLGAGELSVRFVAVRGEVVVGHVRVNQGADPRLVAYLDSVGYVPVRSGLSEVCQMFVDPANTGQGAGRSLLDVARTHVWESGAQPVLAVLEASQVARTMYTEAGMTEVGSCETVHGVLHTFVDEEPPGWL